MPTPGYVDRLRGGARPRSYRGTRPCFASGTLMSLRTAPTPLCAPDLPTSKTLKGDSPRPTRKTPNHQATDQKGDSSPLPHRQNTQPPGNRQNRDSFPRHSSLDTGRTRNPRASTATPAGPQRTPNTDTRRGAYILCRDIRVSELCEDGSPAGAKRIICTSSLKNVFIPGTQKSRRFRRISGIFFEVRPLGLEPRTH